jgi:hypothetical protein
MSSASFSPAKAGALAAWESQNQVYWTRVNAAEGKAGDGIAPNGKGRNRKHPVAAENRAGQVLLAWTEETGWNKGGKVAWQTFEANGDSTQNIGKADGVPVWSLATVFATSDGFVIMY